MAKSKITRRQKNIFRLIQEKRALSRGTINASKEKGRKIKKYF